MEAVKLRFHARLCHNEAIDVCSTGVDEGYRYQVHVGVTRLYNYYPFLLVIDSAWWKVEWDDVMTLHIHFATFTEVTEYNNLLRFAEVVTVVLHSCIVDTSKLIQLIKMGRITRKLYNIIYRQAGRDTVL